MNQFTTRGTEKLARSAETIDRCYPRSAARAPATARAGREGGARKLRKRLSLGRARSSVISDIRCAARQISVAMCQRANSTAAPARRSRYLLLPINVRIPSASYASKTPPDLVSRGVIAASSRHGHHPLGCSAVFGVRDEPQKPGVWGLRLGRRSGYPIPRRFHTNPGKRS
jgi:hypothetical protein